MSESKTQQQEPSMEEILASIRRIISEDGEDGDQDGKNRSDPPAATNGHDLGARPAPPSEEPVMELTEAQIAPAEDGRDEPDDDDGASDAEAPASEEPMLELSDDEPLDDPEPAEPEPSAAAEPVVPSPAPAPAARAPEDPPKPMADTDDDKLVSDATEAATGAAFARFLDSKVRAEAQSATPVGVGDGAKTLEDLVKELLRPLLREWMDENLPRIVERVVEREVERMGRHLDR